MMKFLEAGELQPDPETSNAKLLKQAIGLDSENARCSWGKDIR